MLHALATLPDLNTAVPLLRSFVPEACGRWLNPVATNDCSIKAFNEMAKILKKSRQLELEWTGGVMVRCPAVCSLVHYLSFAPDRRPPVRPSVSPCRPDWELLNVGCSAAPPAALR